MQAKPGNRLNGDIHNTTKAFQFYQPLHGWPSNPECSHARQARMHIEEAMRLGEIAARPVDERGNSVSGGAAEIIRRDFYMYAEHQAEQTLYLALACMKACSDDGVNNSDNDSDDWLP